MDNHSCEQLGNRCTLKSSWVYKPTSKNTSAQKTYYYCNKHRILELANVDYWTEESVGLPVIKIVESILQTTVYKHTMSLVDETPTETVHTKTCFVHCKDGMYNSANEWWTFHFCDAHIIMVKWI